MGFTGNNSWTADEQAIVRRLADDGLSFSEMVLMLPGRTRNGVAGFCHREGIILGKTRADDGQLSEPVRSIPKIATVDISDLDIINIPIDDDILAESSIDGIPFHRTRPFTCRWINLAVQVVATYDAPTCGKPAVTGYSWCSEHCDMVFQKFNRNIFSGHHGGKWSARFVGYS